LYSPAFSTSSVLPVNKCFDCFQPLCCVMTSCIRESVCACTYCTACLVLPASVNLCVHTPSVLPALYCCTAQGHPVAIVTARETAAGLSTVLGSAMRQLLGSPTPADDVEALLAWWAEEWGRHYSSSSVGTARLSQLTPGKNAKQQQQQQTAMAYHQAAMARELTVRRSLRTLLNPTAPRSARSAAQHGKSCC